MNYRHHYHAGNFADVVKHAALLQLVRAMQRKEKGFLYLDTHAGRGTYDLAAETRGLSQERKPEWPEGIGRLWREAGLCAGLAEYVSLVNDYDRRRTTGKRLDHPLFYPGSPSLVKMLLRAQDRMCLCEMHPEEHEVLDRLFEDERRISVQLLDGYTGMRAALPPPEKRALVLIDPPYESAGEFRSVLDALAISLQRMSGATYVIWYPLTTRAKVDDFLTRLVQLKPPPTLQLELSIAGVDSGLSMRGCGLVVINPPWQIDRVFEPMLRELSPLLEQGPGAESVLRWVVPEV